jgi:hypothetical protein
MGNGSIAPPFLTSALDGGQWSCPSCFTPREWASGTHWVGPRVNLDAVEGEEKNLALPGIEPGPSSP